MKTREIKVYLKKSQYDNVNVELDNCSYYTKNDLIKGVEYLSATLVIEIPEQKIEITESQFDDAQRAVQHRYQGDLVKPNTYAVLMQLRDELGFK